MLILISPEKDLKNEISILNQLFEAGLECFHLRKPTYSKEEMMAYIKQIDAKFHDRIVLHSFHELVNKFNVRGIHFSESLRVQYIDHPSQYFMDLNMFGKTISSSFHEIKDIENCYFEFDYHFLSPVFNSISKENYPGRHFDVNKVDKDIIALGGMTSENINQIKDLGFKGAAVLGSLWNAENPVEYFKILITNFG
ncbi:thiamine phosphate synthase [Weeksellaceae bacterium KMM 9713]|uniref:Thiamine phosphate synthase n=1 Tax=Profundicola chukchiensis TaxID=2961959 RepID=A0A9X4RXF8_9FLAO|nr:thiamine phosphate synthase [Profundicola chukchiensis]MDG4946319.1 thiamine phosphate synthase [Profundicola chukchiensis]